MSVFNIISLLGGLALFLFGMSTMSTGLERASGGKLEKKHWSALRVIFLKGFCWVQL